MQPNRQINWLSRKILQSKMLIQVFWGRSAKLEGSGSGLQFMKFDCVKGCQETKNAILVKYNLLVINIFSLFSPLLMFLSKFHNKIIIKEILQHATAHTDWNITYVVTFYWLLSFVKRFLTSVGRPVPPIRYSGLWVSTRETVAMFVVVFTVVLRISKSSYIM